MDTTITAPAAPRQRLEGTLHRSLPADITVRAAEPGAADDGLLRLRLAFSSEAPVLRRSFFEDDWVEILGHNPTEIDLGRMNNGSAVVLANHSRDQATGSTPLASIGVVERAWIEGGRGMADLVISRRESLADLRQDIADGLVRNVSVGYSINERTLRRAATRSGDPAEYRVTSWAPYEISLVDIPADATVGLGRAADDTQPRTPQYRVVDLPAPGATSGAIRMSETIAPAADTQSAAPAVTAARSADLQVGGLDHLAAERARAREILAIGRQFDVSDLADAAIDAGTSLDAFRHQVLGRMRDTGKIRVAESPEIGMSEAEIKQFSFCRAMLAAADPVNAARIAPFEMEASRAAQDKRGDSRDKIREAAMTIPVDVLSRGLVVPQDMARSAARMLLSRVQRNAGAYGDMMRDLVVGTPPPAATSSPPSCSPAASSSCCATPWCSTAWASPCCATSTATSPSRRRLAAPPATGSARTPPSPANRSRPSARSRSPRRRSAPTPTSPAACCCSRAWTLRCSSAPIWPPPWGR
jgi:hypothetical protein